MSEIKITTKRVINPNLIGPMKNSLKVYYNGEYQYRLYGEWNEIMYYLDHLANYINKTHREETDPVEKFKQKYKNKWRDKPDSYWFYRLSQEVGELGSVLARDHEDTIEHELAQIASICLNWLDKGTEDDNL